MKKFEVGDPWHHGFSDEGKLEPFIDDALVITSK